MIVGASTLFACGPSDRTVAMAGATRITQSQVTAAASATEVLQGVNLLRTNSSSKSQALAVAEQQAVVNWALSHHVISSGQAEQQAQQWITHHASSHLTSSLLAHHLSSQDFRRYVAAQLILQRVFDRITQGVQPRSLAQQQSYYNNNAAFYVSPGDVLVRNITVSSSQRATSLLKQIKAGVSFAALALKDSKDPDRVQGGSRGWVELGASSRLPSTWIEALTRLKPGGMSIVKGPLGYSIIEVQASRAGAAVPFHVVQPAIQAELVQSDKTRLFNHWATNVTDRAHVHLLGS